MVLGRVSRIRPRGTSWNQGSHFGTSFSLSRYHGFFALGKIDSYFPISVVITRLATLAANWISSFSSAPLKAVSHLAGHLAVRIATMSAVALRSDGPSFGQS